MDMTKRILLLGTLSLLLFSCNRGSDFDATGTFEATETTLSAEATGKIIAFDAEEGATVREGQLLGCIDSTTLVLQREVLKNQQAALLASRPNVQKQVAALRAQIAKQETELARIKKMRAGGAATGKQVDDAESQLLVLQSNLDATLQTLHSSAATVDGNAAALEAQMRLLDDQIAHCRIVAPTDGTVLVRYVQRGEMVALGKPILKVADLEQVYLRAYFTSDQLAHIKLGQEVTVVADFGGSEQHRYKGTVTWIASESEFTPKGIQTRNSRANLVYAAKIAVKNDGRLKIGLYGEVEL